MLPLQSDFDLLRSALVVFQQLVVDERLDPRVRPQHLVDSPTAWRIRQLISIQISLPQAPNSINVNGVPFFIQFSLNFWA